MPSEHPQSLPPTAIDIATYEAAAATYRARRRQNCSICLNNRLRCFCEAIYGSDSETEPEHSNDGPHAGATGTTKPDHAGHGVLQTTSNDATTDATPMAPLAAIAAAYRARQNLPE